MTRDDIKKNINKAVIINGKNDLMCCGNIRPYIKTHVFTIIKLTRAGMAYLHNDKGIYISVPPVNVDLIDDNKLNKI